MNKLTQIKSLNNSGIAHFVLPLIVVVLVAIGGTAFLVASHADSPKKTGYLVLNSNDGLYKRAAIGYSENVQGAVNKNITCNGKKLNADRKHWSDDIFPLKSKGTTTLKCSASNFHVFYLKSNQSTKNVNWERPSTYVSVALPDDYCAFVKKKGTPQLVKVNENGKCVPTSAASAGDIDKQTPILSSKVNPNPVVIGKTGYSYKITIKLPGDEDLSREECAGSVVVNRLRSGSGFNTRDDRRVIEEVALRYKAKENVCYYEILSSKNDVIGYDAQYRKDNGGSWAGERTEITKFLGNKYLNPASDTYTYSVRTQ